MAQADTWYVAAAGVLVLLGWIGLGWVICRALRLERRLRGWGTWAAWGMAATLAVGGMLNLLQVTSVAILGWATVATAIPGALALLNRRRLLRQRHRFVSLILPFAVVAISVYVAAAASTRINPIDDQLKYLVFPRQMLATGTLIVPFHLHRLGTYGGHQFLQAQIIATAQVVLGPTATEACQFHAHVLDEGLCALTAAGLLWALVRPRRGWSGGGVLALLACCLFWLTPIPRVNTHSQVSGIVLFLALLQLLAISRFSWHTAIMIGAIAAAAATLRSNFLVAAVAIVLAGLLARQPWLRIRHWALALAVLALCLLPWALVMFQSSGTPLYPMFKGFQNGSVAIWDHPMTLLSRLTWSLHSLLYPKTLFLFLPALLMTRWPRRTARSASIGLYVAAFLAAFAIAWSMPASGIPNIYRLSSPILLAASSGVLAISLRQRRLMSARLRLATAVLALAMPSVLAVEYSDRFLTSNPLFLLPLGLLALWTPHRPRIRLLFHSLMIVGLAYWGLCNAGLLFNNSGLFAVATAAIALGWLAGSTCFPILRVPAWMAAAIVSLAAIPGLALTFGGLLLVELVLLALALAGILAFTRGSGMRWRGSLGIALATLAVGLAMFERDFLFNDHASMAIAALIATIAWILFHAQTTLLRIAAFLALTLTVLLGVRSLASAGGMSAQLALACGTLALAACLLIATGRHWQHLAAATIVVGILPLGIAQVRHLDAFLHTTDSVRSAEMQARKRDYQHAQEAIPAGTRILVLVAQPVRFDYLRNRIEVIDDVHAYVSPPPGLSPAPEPLQQYLAGLGIRYAILSGPAEPSSEQDYHVGVWLPLSQLQQTRRILYQSPRLVVLDLADTAAK